jgi:hypothetical protein
MKKPGNDDREPCDQPAAWIVWVTDLLTGQPGPKKLACGDHHRTLSEHLKTCWFHRASVRLHAEPLR